MLDLGNHYAPDYYGIEEPIEYARWLAAKNITIWIYSYGGGEKVQQVLNFNYPGLFIYLGENPYAKVFGLNLAELHEIVVH